MGYLWNQRTRSFICQNKWGGKLLMSDAHYTCDFSYWFASLDSSHALPLLSNYSQVSERSYGCHLCGVRNLELSERLVASPFFLSIASPRRVPRGTVSDGRGSEFWMFMCRMAQQAHGKMFEVDLPLYSCDWGTMACRLPVPASHQWPRETSPSLFLQGILMHPWKTNSSWKTQSKLPGFVLFCNF